MTNCIRRRARSLACRSHTHTGLMITLPSSSLPPKCLTIVSFKYSLRTPRRQTPLKEEYAKGSVGKPGIFSFHSLDISAKHTFSRFFSHCFFPTMPSRNAPSKAFSASPATDVESCSMRYLSDDFILESGVWLRLTPGAKIRSEYGP